ncbi:hypothetical protein PR048_009370 [Dryococelus australis]|uniref:DDE-1 domain-containing protein n=1 Tax=Dryococelus australis TaxID=614101 RepID=A0ABQ9HZP0_9NEOP|nr:hypothetical protein PR048_009370 [Dryococelus australis]
MPGWEWSYSFLQRHKHELAHKLRNNLSRKLAQVNDNILKTFLTTLKMRLSNHLYNYDETAFHDNPKKKLTLFRRSCRHLQRIRNSTKSCCTTLFCGNAEGVFILPYIILYGAPPGTKLNVSKSGWIEHEIFDDWFENHFLLCVKNKVGKKVLIGDNLSSHITIRSLQLAKKNEVVLNISATKLNQFTSAFGCSIFRKSEDTFKRDSSTVEGIKTRKGDCCFAKKTLDLGESTASQNLVKGWNFLLDLITLSITVLEKNSRSTSKILGRVILVLLKDQESIVFLLNQEKMCLPNKFKSFMKTKIQAEDVNEEVLLNYRDLNGINLSDASNEEHVAPSNGTALFGNNISESEDITALLATVSGPCNEVLYLKDDFVIVKYDGTLYPGKVTDIHDELYKVRCMVKSAAYWKWPDKHDKFCVIA